MVFESGPSVVFQVCIDSLFAQSSHLSWQYLPRPPQLCV